jgi:DinB family protein
MTGNLNYYIGAQVAGTGYRRDRDREFAEPERPPKAQLLAAFDRAIAMVIETIQAQSGEDWLKPYAGEREPEARERFAIFLRCAGHAYHHVGQLIFLAREAGQA